MSTRVRIFPRTRRRRRACAMFGVRPNRLGRVTKPAIMMRAACAPLIGSPMTGLVFFRQEIWVATATLRIGPHHAGW
jgi:hypothetical protein